MLYSFLVHFFGPLISLFNGRQIVANKVDLPEGNYVLVAPHRTWMDPIFLALAVYPKKLGFMAKEELFKGKFANYFLRKLKDLFKRQRRKVAIGKPIYIDRKMKLTEENLAQVEQELQTAFDALDKQLDPTYHYVVPKKTKKD